MSNPALTVDVFYSPQGKGKGQRAPRSYGPRINGRGYCFKPGHNYPTAAYWAALSGATSGTAARFRAKYIDTGMLRPANAPPPAITHTPARNTPINSLESLTEAEALKLIGETTDPGRLIEWAQRESETSARESLATAIMRQYEAVTS